MAGMLKTGIFGIACAMSMMHVAQVKADLSEDYQAIKAAIEEHRSQFTPVENLLKANPKEAKEIALYKNNIKWCNGLAFGGEMLPDKERPAYIARQYDKIREVERMLGITVEMKKTERENIAAGLTNLTFGDLKAKLKNNEYIESVSQAVANYLPNADLDNRLVLLSGNFYHRLADAQKMEDGWIVYKGETTSATITKGNIGVSFGQNSVYLYDPLKVYPEKIDISSRKISSESPIRPSSRRGRIAKK